MRQPPPWSGWAFVLMGFPLSAAVAGIVLLLPGFMITIAMSEIATQNALTASSFRQSVPAFRA